jgi:hypothetical protein
MACCPALIHSDGNPGSLCRSTVYFSGTARSSGTHSSYLRIGGRFWNYCSIFPRVALNTRAEYAANPTSPAVRPLYLAI